MASISNLCICPTVIYWPEMKSHTIRQALPASAAHPWGHIPRVKCIITSRHCRGSSRGCVRRLLPSQHPLLSGILRFPSGRVSATGLFVCGPGLRHIVTVLAFCLSWGGGGQSWQSVLSLHSCKRNQPISSALIGISHRFCEPCRMT